MQCAYACLLETVLENDSRLQLSKEMLLKAGQIPSDKMLQSWRDLYNELAEGYGIDAAGSDNAMSNSKTGDLAVMLTVHKVKMKIVMMMFLIH